MKFNIVANGKMENLQFYVEKRLIMESNRRIFGPLGQVADLWFFFFFSTIIQCTCLKIVCNSKTADRSVNFSTMWH